MFLKNKITGSIGNFPDSQGEEWQELSPSELVNYNKEKLKKKLINVRLSYLNSTDWYIAREFDEPDSYPKEIKAARIRARREIEDIKNCNNLEELEQFQ